MDVVTVRPILGVTERVERGARHLDAHEPGWWRSIDVDELDMGSQCDCVLGQMFGHYIDGAREVGLAPYREESDDYGFSVFDAADYAELTEKWRFVIRGRQTQGEEQ